MFWRTIAAMTALAALLYIGAAAVLYFNQRQMLYHPEATWRVVHAPDVELVNEGVTLRGWVVNPGRARALLYFGGNGERVEDLRDAWASWFPGRTIYLLPYRGYAASGGEPEERALVADAVAWFDRTAAAHVSVAVIGRSLGSGVAVQLAAARPVERLALVTPFDSMVRVAQAFHPWMPIDWLARERFESWRYATKVSCPVLILRAEQDELVAAPRTAALAARFAVRPLEQVVADAGHNSIQDYPEYRVDLTRFMQ
ncbi:alpha/beta hydrolase [Dyella sp. BiH032]|uniref:alpha/beta hydrolase n=1 Tax=Dyella sp. BiH032 TaxID=3075430 RepID=UPI0028930E06|nr:alpha/beta hydrolase [Dyella sp. BiH032]WNL45837.1 alpha/beta hydrolase [Dyella sp. BiH032]